MMGESGRSPWVYVGCGCGAIAIVAVIALSVSAFFVIQAFNEFEQSIEDPVKRAGATQRVLGYDEIPEGYVPGIGIKIPFFLEVGVITDEASTRAFFFVRFKRWVTNDDALEQIFEGQGHPSRVFTEWNENDIRVRGREPIGEGVVTVRGREIPYAAQRGSMKINRDRMEGIVAAFVAVCDDDQRPGLGGWIVPDQPELEGTPADPAALTVFLSNFELCR